MFVDADWPKEPAAQYWYREWGDVLLLLHIRFVLIPPHTIPGQCVYEDFVKYLFVLIEKKDAEGCCQVLK